jgi:hypothetical protein
MAAIMRDVTERFEEVRRLKRGLADATKSRQGDPTKAEASVVGSARAHMTKPRSKLGLALGIVGVFLFGGTPRARHHEPLSIGHSSLHLFGAGV